MAEFSGGSPERAAKTTGTGIGRSTKIPIERRTDTSRIIDNITITFVKLPIGDGGGIAGGGIA